MKRQVKTKISKGDKATLTIIGMRQGIYPLEDQTKLFHTYQCSQHGIFEERILYVAISPETYCLFCLQCIEDFLAGKIDRQDMAFIEQSYDNKKNQT